jgi:ferredoxin
MLEGAAETIQVRFAPSGREVPVPAGTSLLAAAQLAGLPLGSSCRGEGACGWCRVRVLEGSERLSAPSARERALLVKLQAAASERLACQALVLGEVTLTTSYW